MTDLRTGRRCFFSPGVPVPQGSKRAVAPGVVRESARGLRAWRERVRASAIAAGWTGAPPDSPVAVGLLFVRARPASHYVERVEGDETAGVRRAAIAMPTARRYGDVDKLERAILDALTGTCWSDDSRVALVRKAKVWGPRDGAWIFVRHFEPRPDAWTLRRQDGFDAEAEQAAHLVLAWPGEGEPW